MKKTTVLIAAITALTLGAATFAAAAKAGYTCCNKGLVCCQLKQACCQ